MSRSCTEHCIGGAKDLHFGRFNEQRLLDRFLPRMGPFGVDIQGASGMERLSLASRRGSARKAAS